MTEIVNLARTRALLAKHGFTFKKSLGQNFLVDPNVLRLIAEAAELDKETGVIEVGPGLGTLTEALAQKAGGVLAFEIDQRLIPILEETLAAYPHVKVVHQDVLQADLVEWTDRWLASYPRLSVVANLPYYVTTPILFHFIESGLSFERMVLMVQREVAERMTAEAGTKAYGSLTIMIRYFFIPELVRVVPKHVFIPKPRVDSALLKLSRRSSPAVQVTHEAFFFKLVRASFAMRRKTLVNNLTEWLGGDNKDVLLNQLDELGIDPLVRGESLTIEQFALLANRLYERIGLKS